MRWVIPSVFATSPVLDALGTISKSIAWLAACGFGLIVLISLFLNKRFEPQAFKSQKQKKQKTVREESRFKINAPDKCANGATPASLSPRCYYSFRKRVIKSGSRKGRRNYPVDFKKQLAVAACTPSVSVARLALDNGIHANMLHTWRRQHLADELGTWETSSSNFLEVSMTPSQNTLPIVPKQASSRRVDGIVPQPVSRQTSGNGVIAIRLATATLCLEGAIDAATLAQVLRHLYP